MPLEEQSINVSVSMWKKGRQLPVVEQNVQLLFPTRKFLGGGAHRRQVGKVELQEIDILLASLGLNLVNNCHRLVFGTSGAVYFCVMG